MSKITTIKLQKNTKESLMLLKEKSESYDSAVSRLISIAKNKDLRQELIEAYSKNPKKDLQILKEWENSSKEVDF